MPDWIYVYAKPGAIACAGLVAVALAGLIVAYTTRNK
jgi:hypothetical protein